MVCFELMTTWNTHNMTGCTHSVCIACADRMQPSYADYDSDESAESAESDEIDEPALKVCPKYVTVKYSLEGCKITYLCHFVLNGIENTLQCPYCRQNEPMWYDFDDLRYFVPYFTTEWNILDHKINQDKITFFTMTRDGNTFAFKLSKDGSFLRIIYTNVTQYYFPLPRNNPTYSIHKTIVKQKKDVRAYKRPKQYIKMIR
jgi:hypothetical protein